MDREKRSLKGFFKRFYRELVLALLLAIVAGIAIDRWKVWSEHRALELNRKAVATIIVFGPDGDVMAQGSGFFIDSDGLLATNAHVMEGVASAEAKLPTGAIYRMKAIKSLSVKNDLALLQFDAEETPFIRRLGNSDDIQTGEKVYAIGTPQGQESTFSEGNVSNPQRDINGKTLIQFTAPISPGSSGGGLFNESDEVIGVTSNILNIPSGSQAGLSENLNYAVPVNDLKAMIADTGSPKGNAAYYYGQGTVAENRKDWEKAIDCYSKTLELDSTYAAAYIGLGGAYYQAGNYDQELKNYLTATSVDPSNSEAHYVLATAYEDVGQYKDAFSEFGTALRLDPNDKDINHDFAVLCLAAGDKKDAQSLIKKLSQLDQGWGKVLQAILDHEK